MIADSEGKKRAEEAELKVLRMNEKVRGGNRKGHQEE